MVVLSCTTREVDSISTKIDFTNPLQNIDPIEDWIQVKDVVSLVLPDSLTVGKILQLEFTDTEIIIFEEGIYSSVLVFDRMGGFKRQLLRMGVGPGEYEYIQFILLTNESIIVYNRAQMKLIAYSWLDFNDFQEYRVEDYFMGGIGRLENNRLFLVSDSDFEGEFYKGYGFFDNDLTNNRFIPQFVGVADSFLQSSISQFQRNYYMTQPFSDLVFKFIGDSLVLSHHIDFGSKAIPFLDVAVIPDAYEFYDFLERGSYYFAPTNLLIGDSVIAFNFFNETVDDLNFGLIQNGQAYRFSIDSDLKELFLKPIAVREDLFHTVLLPGEYDEEVMELLNLTEVDYEKPILVSYTIGQ